MYVFFCIDFGTSRTILAILKCDPAKIEIAVLIDFFFKNYTIFRLNERIKEISTFLTNIVSQAVFLFVIIKFIHMNTNMRNFMDACSGVSVETQKKIGRY